MHTLGGATVALGALWTGARFFGSGEPEEERATWGLFLAAVIVAGGMGVGWELFEWYAGITSAEEAFPDTAHDLLADLAGALAACAYVYGRKLFHGRERIR